MTALATADRRRETLGLALGLLGVVIFAMTLPMTRLAVGPASDPQLPPFFVTAGRAACAGLLAAIYLLLVRAPRPGREPTYGREERDRVLALTLEPPPDGVTHWSARRMAARTGISITTVQRIWAEAGFRPTNPEIAAEFSDKFFTPASLHTIDELGGWDAVDAELFGDNGAITTIYKENTK